MMGESNPFTMTKITDKKGLSYLIVLFVYCVSYSIFVPRHLHYCLLLRLADFFVGKCLNSFLIPFCVYSIGIFFMVTMGITFNFVKL